MLYILPTKEAHHSVHPTEGAIGYAQRMNPKFAEKKFKIWWLKVLQMFQRSQELKNIMLTTPCALTQNQTSLTELITQQQMTLETISIVHRNLVSIRMLT